MADTAAFAMIVGVSLLRSFAFMTQSTMILLVFAASVRFAAVESVACSQMSRAESPRKADKM
jgi:hypothetical protein